ncbi:MAG: glutamine--fructose-6-phosphate transaminase (isomerizing) [Candidatus Moranbacteria bacterium]|nr:glutamine--fructose-6-phosphate transaminase (isomerizing) [Candidatus Moranbacteria bacterium]
MCGIVGYVGKRSASPILFQGLTNLEYRGYDSAGIALGGESEIRFYKYKGTVKNLENVVSGRDLHGTIGIGHTRWATHGEPSDLNAHPHLSQDGTIALVHNGIIENARTISSMLEEEGYVFISETDTEVLAHLIEFVGKKADLSFSEAVREALVQVEGTFAVAVISSRNPDTMVVARRGSPLVVGIRDSGSEFFVASDALAFAEHTRFVAYLKENEIAVLRSGDDFRVSAIKGGKKRHPEIIEIEEDLAVIGKEGFDHFMEKEIFEQPRTVRDSMRGRLDPKTGSVRLGGLDDYMGRLAEADRIVFVACGTSYYAAVLGEYLIERYAGIPVEVEYASEFRYRHPLIRKSDFVIAVSQSGETADTLAAIRLAKESGATVLGICNVVGSSIARATDAGVYTHAGPEIGVASTKAFTAQVTVLALLALALAEKRHTLSCKERKRLARELYLVPDKIETTLETRMECESIAEQYAEAENAFYLGRGVCYPVAMEGALKLKEISYVHAEGYPAGEMKHGPIALVEDGVPVVVLAPNAAETHEKVISNIREMKARRGSIVAIVTEGDAETASLANHTVSIPEADEFVLALIAVIPLQLIAYYSATIRGCDVDRPRNLAKSVTVE